MSSKLALSSALSVMMMAAFVLFGSDPHSASLGAGFDLNPLKAAASALPTAGQFLPLGR